MTTHSEYEIFFRAGTGTVSDALDLLGLNGGLKGLARLSGTGVIAGPAFTVRFEPVEPGASAPAADYVDDVPAGSVIVIANAGRTYCTVWGGLLTYAAILRRAAGTVIDGCCRDLDEITDLGYPLWAVSSYMKSGKNRVRLADVGLPVLVGGVTVRPSDIICADSAGVLAVPVERLQAVLEQVRRVLKVEMGIRADLAHGIPLREARERHGYNRVALSRPGGESLGDA